MKIIKLLLIVAIISGCSSIPRGKQETQGIAEQYTINLNSHDLEIFQLIFYSDLITFPLPSKGIREFITFDEQTGKYYVPAEIGENFRLNNFNISTVPVYETGKEKIVGFSCTRRDTVIYIDKEGKVYKTSFKEGKWSKEILFKADVAADVAAADKESIYICSYADGGIYKFSHSGNYKAFIKIENKYPDGTKGLGAESVVAMDAKSRYLYLFLKNENVIALVDYEAERIENIYLGGNTDKTISVKQENDGNTALLLLQKRAKEVVSYGIFPLSTLHLARIADGYIKKLSAPFEGYHYVITDIEGNIIFYIKSSLLNLDNYLSKKITITGFLLEDSSFLDSSNEFLTVTEIKDQKLLIDN